MKRLIGVGAFMAIGVAGFALMSFPSVFNKTYGIAKDSALDKASCMVCHTSKRGGKLNAYGKDLKAVLVKAGTKRLTAEVLHSVDGLDSTKSGATNLSKIKAGKNPGAVAAE
jgi:hypothetical protein